MERLALGEERESLPASSAVLWAPVGSAGGLGRGADMRES